MGRTEVYRQVAVDIGGGCSHRLPLKLKWEIKARKPTKEVIRINMPTDTKTDGFKIVIYNEKGDIESEYVIDHTQKKGGPQVFMVATENDGPEGTTRCIAYCSGSFLTSALMVNAAKNDWLRNALSSVLRGTGFFGFLKSSSGSFLLGVYSMMGLYWFIDGLKENHIGWTIAGAIIAGVCFCAHNFLPARRVPKNITE